MGRGWWMIVSTRCRGKWVAALEPCKQVGMQLPSGLCFAFENIWRGTGRQ